MKTKEITVNGYKFTVESSIDDDNCYRLMYGDAVVLDDTAYEDFYGDIDTVADIMAEMVKEETSKKFPWFTLSGAIVENGSEAVRIFGDKEAQDWAEIINAGNPKELTDEKEISKAKAALGFDEEDEVQHIYSFVNGHLVMENDY